MTGYYSDLAIFKFLFLFNVEQTKSKLSVPKRDRSEWNDTVWGPRPGIIIVYDWYALIWTSYSVFYAYVIVCIVDSVVFSRCGCAHVLFVLFLLFVICVCLLVSSLCVLCYPFVVLVSSHLFLSIGSENHGFVVPPIFHLHNVCLSGEVLIWWCLFVVAADT